MKPPPFDYHDPRSVGETVALLAELDNAKVLAGGQSLMPMLNLRLAYPDHLVDINRVTELDRIDWDSDQHGKHNSDRDATLRIGATVRQRTAELDPRIAARLPLLTEALGHVGHFQTRNRGTVCGSIAHLDPASEMAAVASATDATVLLRSARGTRTVAFAEYPLGILTPDIEPDELLVAVDFPVWPPGHGYAFEEFARRHGDFAIVAVAALLELDPDRQVRRCALCLLGLGPVPVRATEAELQLAGQRPTMATVDLAVEALAALPVSGDQHAPAEYRRHLARTLTRRALCTAARRAGWTDEEAR
jgi:carbon-monoxide dehydrogenase medium subunit